MMYASVRRWKTEADRFDDAKQRIEKGFLPDLRQIEGFVAYYLVGGEGGEVATISIFGDQRGAQESTRLARAFAERELEGIILAPPEIIEGEVAVQALSQEAGQKATPGSR